MIHSFTPFKIIGALVFWSVCLSDHEFFYVVFVFSSIGLILTNFKVQVERYKYLLALGLEFNFLSGITSPLIYIVKNYCFVHL